MRLSELFEQDNGYVDELEDDLNDLLTIAKASGIEQIETKKVINQLAKMGHNITASLLLQQLQNNKIIANATLDQITFDNGITKATAMDPDEAKDKVQSIATKSAMKGIKS